MENETINQTADSLISFFSNLVANNQSIPLTILTTNQTNWNQFAITTIIGLFGIGFILYIMFSASKESIYGIVLKHKLARLKKKLGIHILVMKHTSSDMFNVSMIGQNTLMKINQAFAKFEGKPFLFILQTPGGMVFHSIFISRLLKQYPGKIKTYIPGYAMSGGTLLALSTDELYMNESSCLGPIDPQLGNLFKFGSAKAWNQIVKKKGIKAEDSTISFDLMGQQVTKSMVNNLNYLLDDKLTAPQKKTFIKFVTSGGVDHGHNLIPSDLRSFGFEVKPIPKELNELLMKIVNSKYIEGIYYV